MNRKLVASAVVVAVAIAACLVFWKLLPEQSGTTEVAAGTPDDREAEVAQGASSTESKLRPIYRTNPRILESDSPIKERIADFRLAAESDHSIALDLSRTIAGCAFVTDEATVQILLEESLRSAREAERMATLNDNCDGISDDDYLLALDLVDRAAAAGLLEAQIEYEVVGAQVIDREKFGLDVEMISEYRRKSVSYLSQAAQSGSANAMYRLSFLYSEGHLVPSDAGQALRHYRAYLDASGRYTRQSRERLRQLEAAAGATSQ